MHILSVMLWWCNVMLVKFFCISFVTAETLHVVGTVKDNASTQTELYLLDLIVAFILT